MSKRILFVLHNAERMGAPMVILHLIRWIKQNKDTDITILLKAGGPLLQEFEKLGSVFLWRLNLLPSSPGRRIVSRVLKAVGKAGLYVPFPPALRAQKIDLIYLNTADTLDLAPMLKRFFHAPAIAHIHELGYSLNTYFPDAFKPENQSAIDGYIAAHDSVKANMVKSYNINAAKITVINEFIPVNEIARPTKNAADIKAGLGITANHIIGAAGQAGWRKGSDIFIRVAAKVLKKSTKENVAFVWVGDVPAEVRSQLDYEIEKFGLEGRIYFTGSKPEPQNYIQLFDVFLLTSREDPFPLVCLEAAALQKPIFCFENTGGIPSIITNETGRVFNYGDTGQMASGIIEFIEDAGKRKQTGAQAAELVKNYDINKLAPRLYNLLNEY